MNITAAKSKYYVNVHTENTFRMSAKDLYLE